MLYPADEQWKHLTHTHKLLDKNIHWHKVQEDGCYTQVCQKNTFIMNSQYIVEIMVCKEVPD